MQKCLHVAVDVRKRVAQGLDRDKEIRGNLGITVWLQAPLETIRDIMCCAPCFRKPISQKNCWIVAAMLRGFCNSVEP